MRFASGSLCKLAIALALFFPTITLHAQNVPSGAALPAATVAPVPAAYSTNAVNTVRTYTPFIITNNKATVTAPGTVLKDVSISTDYLDGLNRNLQTVIKGASPAGYDIVAPTVYDAYGRQQYKYLPYVQTNVSDGNFKTDPFNSQQTFYKNTTINPGLQNEQVFYQQTQFEASPLNRITKTYEPGNSWASTGGNHPTQKQYLLNTTTDSIRIWRLPANGNIPTSNAAYAVGTLGKDVLTDPQGHVSVSFTDKDNHVILKKISLSNVNDGHTGWLCTYYIYDDLGNLRFILPPKAVDTIRTNWTIPQAIADGLCYQYTYDSHGRQITRKLPGVGIQYMVYDTRDRLVFSQDSSMRAQGQWFTVFYDGQNRAVMTALYPSTQTADQLQTLLNNATPATTTLVNSFPGTADLIVGTRITGQTTYEATNSVTLQPGFLSEDNADFTASINTTLQGNTEQVTVTNPLPAITGYQPLIYTYYDDYTYPGAQSLQSGEFSSLHADPANSPYAIPSNNISTVPRGHITGNKVRILGTDQWLSTTFYYDNNGHQVQNISNNQVGGLNIVSVLYDFTGHILSTYNHQTNPQSGMSPETKVVTTYAYNNQQELAKVSKQINGGATKIISQNTYDELGRIQKHVLDSSLETINYEYNVQGWLKSINKDYVANGFTGPSHFGEIINYDQGFTTPQYNGNVSGIIWKGFNNQRTTAYGFNYDKKERLTVADYRQQNTSGATYTNDKADFSVNNISYDANGNLISMNQQGLKAGQIAPIDQLHYQLIPGTNKQQFVWDGISDPTSTMGDFRESTANSNANKTTGTPDYAYDGNGNMVADQNKAISNINYNYLNKAQLFTTAANGTVQFLYDAAGNKLRKIITDKTKSPAKVTTIDYIDNIVYRNDTLQFINHEAGRIRQVIKSGQAPKFAYDYFVKDHIGNIREVLTTQSDTALYAATMEIGNSAVENALFSNIDATQVPLPTGYPADNTTSPNAYVAKLNAQNGQKVGPSLVLRVMAGDVVQIGTKSFYTNTGANTPYSPTADIITSLLQAFSGGVISDGPHAGTGGSSPLATNMNSSLFNQLKQLPTSENATDKPKAYLNYVLFDDQFNMVSNNSGNKQVQASPGTLQTLAAGPMTVQSTGFLYIYTSNESNQDVYFDNLVVNHSSGPLLEETHYYPFGLVMDGISANALKGMNYPENRYRYSGKEMMEGEFGDTAGLNLYDFDARNYDPQTSIWTGMDLMAESYSDQSPYNFVMGNPIRFYDPSGMDGDTTNPSESVYITYPNGGVTNLPSYSIPNIVGYKNSGSMWFNFETWLYNRYNSDFVRAIVPDIYTRSIGIYSFMGMGGGISLDASFILHGPHASLLPIITLTTTVAAGNTLDISESTTYTRYMGPVEEIDRKMVETRIDPADPLGSVTYTTSVGVNEGPGVGGTISYTPRSGTQSGAGIISVSQGTSLNLIPGVNVSAGVSNTFILKDTQSYWESVKSTVSKIF